MQGPAQVRVRYCRAPAMLLYNVAAVVNAEFSLEVEDLLLQGDPLGLHSNMVVQVSKSLASHIWFVRGTNLLLSC